jgi:hypothetical protein
MPDETQTVPYSVEIFFDGKAERVAAPVRERTAPEQITPVSPQLSGVFAVCSGVLRIDAIFASSLNLSEI